MPKKGSDPWVTPTVAADLSHWNYTMFVYKSDPEPSIWEMKRKAVAEAKALESKRRADAKAKAESTRLNAIKAAKELEGQTHPGMPRNLGDSVGEPTKAVPLPPGPATPARHPRLGTPLSRAPSARPFGERRGSPGARDRLSEVLTSTPEMW